MPHTSGQWGEKVGHCTKGLTIWQGSGEDTGNCESRCGRHCRYLCQLAFFLSSIISHPDSGSWPPRVKTAPLGLPSFRRGQLPWCWTMKMYKEIRHATSGHALKRNGKALLCPLFSLRPSNLNEDVVAGCPRS